MEEKLNPGSPIMIVDDEEIILITMETMLQMAGLNNTITCQDSRKVMNLIDTHQAGLILMDLNMPHIEGEALLGKISKEYPDIPVIIVTGAIDVETAVRCMKTGAFDYVVKPVEKDRLITAIIRALEFRDLKKENLALKQHILTETLESPEAFSEIITKNKKMLQIFHYIESIAKTSQPVLITGETGVGKELFSRACHQLSEIKGGLVAVNVAGLDDNVFSDTLFGHVRGAFTGADKSRKGLIEQAQNGTLFLDEIGDLSLNSQVKLLRLLQEGEYLPLGQDQHKKTNARILLSANKKLWNLHKAGKFREDLIYRLSTHNVHVPPLRQRMNDLPLLVDHFLAKAAQKLNKKKPTVPAQLLTLLETYPFRGNIRELEAMIFNAVSQHKSKILSLKTFSDYIKTNSREKPITLVPDEDEGQILLFTEYLPTIKEATELIVDEAMRRSNGVQSIASGMLGISHQALSKRIKTRKPKEFVNINL